ncbi:hypothetical protein ACFFF5_18190 [Lederbergia wuyishanensis]|uniref:FlaA1/EpsC-like NDP-sugar epimerase n=1 Tax=Lederbergia wuyishanensis TaxID=1347903 RepID=A0ABU0D4N6_9BACI|nr:hypothetical protein [Lederbergia wuyishanensis]MCJ8008042.1 hypothetical protein [Lederbergia wuyishanensis]MDQ0343373.1 FlaA1/EpsC-like NDP-sugar epimerase [Lederbergia wuyishanensis]
MESYEDFHFVKYEMTFLTIILIGVFISIVFLKKYLKFLNRFSVMLISFICIIISAFNLVMLGYVADEFNFVDTVNSYLFLAIIGFGILNSALAYKNQ